MKLQRPGYTETDLLFCKYLKNIGINDEVVRRAEMDFVLWLYNTAGWYDSSLPFRGPKFINKSNISRTDISIQILQSDVYRFWIEKYYSSIINSDFLIPLCHKNNFKEHYNNHYKNFIESLNSKNNLNKNFDNYWCRYGCIYPLMKDKRILVVSSFADLIKQQYETGNLYRIFGDFPEIVSLDTITFPYTFFNSGPLNNSIETLNQICNEIIQYNFDVLFMAAGCYGAIMVDMVHKMNKIGLTMGHKLNDFFGINIEKNDPYWINIIPEKYIPDGYECIDYGKYWKKRC